MDHTVNADLNLGESPGEANNRANFGSLHALNPVLELSGITAGERHAEIKAHAPDADGIRTFDR